MSHPPNRSLTFVLRKEVYASTRWLLQHHGEFNHPSISKYGATAGIAAAASTTVIRNGRLTSNRAIDRSRPTSALGQANEHYRGCLGGALA
jgi:hypothetical protein